MFCDQEAHVSNSVNWSGGGDIKPDGISEWTIETVTSVAMEFPDKVATCPQRTLSVDHLIERRQKLTLDNSAILTKYTSLRSFYEQTAKGSPLDYEIAGIYTSSLLDAYMVSRRILPVLLPPNQWPRSTNSCGRTCMKVSFPLDC